MWRCAAAVPVGMRAASVSAQLQHRTCPHGSTDAAVCTMSWQMGQPSSDTPRPLPGAAAAAAADPGRCACWLQHRCRHHPACCSHHLLHAAELPLLQLAPLAVARMPQRQQLQLRPLAVARTARRLSREARAATAIRCRCRCDGGRAATAARCRCNGGGRRHSCWCCWCSGIVALCNGWLIMIRAVGRRGAAWRAANSCCSLRMWLLCVNEWGWRGTPDIFMQPASLQPPFNCQLYERSVTSCVAVLPTHTVAASPPHTTMSASKLRAAAAEWTPPPPPRSEPVDTPAAAQPADDARWPSAEELNTWEACDWYEEEDADDHQQQHQQQLEEGDAVALLQSCYPTHAPALLRQLVHDCGGDVQLAATILCDVQFEERRERIAAAAAASGSSENTAAAAAQSRRQAESFALSLEQFPSLGGPSSASSSSGRSAAGNSSSSWAAKAASTSSGSQLRRPQPQPVSSTSGRQQAPAEVPWVETGAAVSQAYAQARAEARDHARVRNQCFQQATLAWQAGDKALAKELSAQGKAAAERMWAAHERAGGQIFSARNAQLPQQAGPRSGPAVIDLHGLHVQEVRSLLPQQLGALADRQQTVASVIVGAGKHTKGAPSARLGPAVEALLQELGYPYSQPQPGLLRVQLR